MSMIILLSLLIETHYLVARVILKNVYLVVLELILLYLSTKKYFHNQLYFEKHVYFLYADFCVYNSDIYMMN